MKLQLFPLLVSQLLLCWNLHVCVVATKFNKNPLSGGGTAHHIRGSTANQQQQKNLFTTQGITEKEQ